MSFFGGLVGLVLGILIYILTASILGVAVVIFGATAGFGSVAALITFLMTLVTPAAWMVIAIYTVVITYVFAYTLATIGLLPAIAAATAPTAAATPAPPPPVAPLPPSPLENFMRGVMIGLTAGLNVGIWLLISPTAAGAAIGLSVGLVGFLAVFPLVSGSVVYQGVLGWLSWVMPMSYLATGVGILLFMVNLPSAIATASAAGAPSPVRFDGLTATIETTGGTIIGITGFTGGFNLGNFSFITPGPPPGGRTAFFGGATGGLSSHETGHTLNAAAFGGVFHWINAVDENLVPFNRRSLAYGELTAESHFQRGGLGFGVGAAPPPLVPLQHVGIW